MILENEELEVLVRIATASVPQLSMHQLKLAEDLVVKGFLSKRFESIARGMVFKLTRDGAWKVHILLKKPQELFNKDFN